MEGNHEKGREVNFLMELLYQVPEIWYKGLYHDEKPCCSAARSFSVQHKEKPAECWLLIHGYRGYPGELVRPAVDLYNAGFDVFVPRLPGHGTCGADFIKSHDRDWIGLAENALADLKTRYETIHLLGHSMGTAIVALIGCNDPGVGKIIYASPSFENKQMPIYARALLHILSAFTPKVQCKWHMSTKYHQHYENAPCDEEYLGDEYWKWYFTKQLIEYYKLMKRALGFIEKHPHEHLVINPLKDTIISGPSAELLKKVTNGQVKIVNIPDGTHSIFYDKLINAEETAVKAVVEFAVDNQ